MPYVKRSLLSILYVHTQNAEKAAAGQLSSLSIPIDLALIRRLVAMATAYVGGLAAGALRRGGEGSGSTARRGRQVPRQTQVSAAADDLGRRRDVVLLQGEVEDGAEAVVLAQPVPVTAREEGPRRTDRSDDDPGQQLVQEQTAARPRRRGQGLQVGSRNQLHTQSHIANTT